MALDSNPTPGQTPAASVLTVWPPPILGPTPRHHAPLPSVPMTTQDPPRAHPPLQPDSGTCSSHPRRTTQTRVNQMLRAATERSHSSTSLPALPDQLAGRDRHSPPAASHRLPRLPSPQEPLQAAPLLWPSDPDPDPEGCSFAYHRHTQPGSIQVWGASARPGGPCRRRVAEGAFPERSQEHTRAYMYTHALVHGHGSVDVYARSCMWA